ncbi:unnamed protein product [Caenorhabditis nigoni]
MVCSTSYDDKENGRHELWRLILFESSVSARSRRTRTMGSVGAEMIFYSCQIMKPGANQGKRAGKPRRLDKKRRNKRRKALGLEREESRKSGEYFWKLTRKVAEEKEKSKNSGHKEGEIKENVQKSMDKQRSSIGEEKIVNNIKQFGAGDIENGEVEYHWNPENSEKIDESQRKSLNTTSGYEKGDVTENLGQESLVIEEEKSVSVNKQFAVGHKQFESGGSDIGDFEFSWIRLELGLEGRQQNGGYFREYKKRLATEQTKQAISTGDNGCNALEVDSEKVQCEPVESMDIGSESEMGGPPATEKTKESEHPAIFVKLPTSSESTILSSEHYLMEFREKLANEEAKEAISTGDIGGDVLEVDSTKMQWEPVESTDCGLESEMGGPPATEESEESEHPVSVKLPTPSESGILSSEQYLMELREKLANEEAKVAITGDIGGNVLEVDSTKMQRESVENTNFGFECKLDEGSSGTMESEKPEYPETSDSFKFPTPSESQMISIEHSTSSPTVGPLGCVNFDDEDESVIDDEKTSDTNYQSLPASLEEGFNTFETLKLDQENSGKLENRIPLDFSKTSDSVMEVDSELPLQNAEAFKDSIDNPPEDLPVVSEHPDLKQQSYSNQLVSNENCQEKCDNNHQCPSESLGQETESIGVPDSVLQNMGTPTSETQLFIGLKNSEKDLTQPINSEDFDQLLDLEALLGNTDYQCSTTSIEKKINELKNLPREKVSPSLEIMPNTQLLKEPEDSHNSKRQTASDKISQPLDQHDSIEIPEEKPNRRSERLRMKQPMILDSPQALDPKTSPGKQMKPQKKNPHEKAARIPRRVSAKVQVPKTKKVPKVTASKKPAKSKYELSEDELERIRKAGIKLKSSDKSGIVDKSPDNAKPKSKAVPDVIMKNSTNSKMSEVSKENPKAPEGATSLVTASKKPATTNAKHELSEDEMERIRKAGIRLKSSDKSQIVLENPKPKNVEQKEKAVPIRTMQNLTHSKMAETSRENDKTLENASKSGIVDKSPNNVKPNSKAASDLIMQNSTNPKNPELSKENPKAPENVTSVKAKTPETTGYMFETKHMVLRSRDDLAREDLKKAYKNSEISQCLIIRNAKPEDEVSMDNDVRNYRRVFNMLDYDVEVQMNLTADEMEQTIKEFGAARNSVIVVFVTHGSIDGIHGIDGEVFEYRKLYSLLGPQNAPDLIGKPKIVLMEHCRGGIRDAGYAIQEPETTDLMRRIGEESEPVMKRSGGQMEKIDKTPTTIPATSDFFLSFSTSPGHPAFGHHIHGSFHVQILCRVIAEEAHRLDLDRITVEKAKTPETTGYMFETKHMVLRSRDDLAREDLKKAYKNSEISQCLIIRNAKPEDEVSMDNDVRNYRRVFNMLDYDVEVQMNLTADEMEQTIKEFGAARNSVIVVFVTHGSIDGIHGIDGEVFEYRKLYSLLGPQNAPDLIGKPKIVLMEHCRGGIRDAGYAIQEPETTDLMRRIGEESEPVMKRSGGQMEKIDKTPTTIPATSDFFLSFSTSPGHPAFGHHIHGSFHVQILCRVIAEEAHRLDLDRITVEVRKRMSRMEISERDGRFKQMPEIRSTLTKSFFLNVPPRLHIRPLWGNVRFA